MSTPPKTSAQRAVAPGAAKSTKSNLAKAVKARATKAPTTKAVKARATQAPTKVASAAKAVTKVASAAKAGRTNSTSPVAADTAPGDGNGPWRGGGRGSGRGRGIYNRQLQRGNERWPIGARILAWLFRRPELLLTLLGRPAPVRVDGRVMNRSIQALLEVMSRLDGLLGGRAAAEGLGDPVVMRKQMSSIALFTMPIRTDVHVVERMIPATGGSKGSKDIPVRVYRRFGTGLGLGPRPPAIVYFHGGGWVVGDLISHDPSCRLLAAVSGCVVVAVDYRLAPEDPFPAAVEDALAAYRWVHGHADELGIADGRVGVMGDSAGGNLAAVVALLTRPGASIPPSLNASSSAVVPAPIAQGLVYPGLSTRFDSESMRLFGKGFLLTEQEMVGYRHAYLPNREDWELGEASPLLTDDVDGVAPALVVTAGFDPLRDDGDDYAAKLREAGVKVEHRCYDDQVHGFFGMGFLADSLALSVEVCAAMGRMMHGDGPRQGQG
ncbi:MAG TPA: alpha/beta hydrolase fold domain-containing protein [Acidimicrobiales bacterium]|jgi:acetyl esterase|nr:alpha/beta hydrolase fold domain-containing protein [Acidimicrobiales bacterium]